MRCTARVSLARTGLAGANAICAHCALRARMQAWALWRYVPASCSIMVHDCSIHSSTQHWDEDLSNSANNAILISMHTVRQIGCVKILPRNRKRWSTYQIKLALQQHWWCDVRVAEVIKSKRVAATRSCPARPKQPKKKTKPKPFNEPKPDNLS